MYQYIEPYAAIYVAFAPVRCLSGDYAMTDAECAHRLPGHLPEFLPRPPDGARPLHRRAQLRFVPRDPHPDKIVVVTPRSSRAAAPRRFLDDELDSLQPAVPGFVVEVAHADQALAVARDQPFRPRHSGAQR